MKQKQWLAEGSNIDKYM